MRPVVYAGRHPPMRRTGHSGQRNSFRQSVTGARQNVNLMEAGGLDAQSISIGAAKLPECRASSKSSQLRRHALAIPPAAASPDVGRTTATMRFGIADAPPAAAKLIPGRWLRGLDRGLRRGTGLGHLHVREHRFGLKGSSRLAHRRTGKDESHDQGQETEAAHCRLHEANHAICRRVSQIGHKVSNQVRSARRVLILTYLQHGTQVRFTVAANCYRIWR